MGLVGVGFLAFMLFTSNPFERLLPAAADGRDLNPLLQDPGQDQESEQGVGDVQPTGDAQGPAEPVQEGAEEVREGHA